MERLNPELSSLVEAERGEADPTAEKLLAVRRALIPRVGGALGAGAAITSLSSSASGAGGGVVAGAAGGLALKVGVSVLVLGAATAVVAPRWLMREEPPQVVGVSPQAPQAVAPREGVEALAHQGVAAEAVVPALEGPPPMSSATRSGTELVAPSNPARAALPPLAEEVRLLKDAQGALRSGRPAAALAALGEHERRFPRGQLALERSAARISALCALGRRAEAARAARVFLERHGGSSLASQVRASCGGVDGPGNK